MILVQLGGGDFDLGYADDVFGGEGLELNMLSATQVSH